MSEKHISMTLPDGSNIDFDHSKAKLNPHADRFTVTARISKFTYDKIAALAKQAGKPTDLLLNQILNHSVQ